MSSLTKQRRNEANRKSRLFAYFDSFDDQSRIRNFPLHIQKAMLKANKNNYERFLVYLAMRKNGMNRWDTDRRILTRDFVGGTERLIPEREKVVRHLIQMNNQFEEGNFQYQYFDIHLNAVIPGK